MNVTPLQLPIFDPMATAWSKVKGSKKSIWAAEGIILLITIGFAILNTLAKNYSSQSRNPHFFHRAIN